MNTLTLTPQQTLELTVAAGQFLHENDPFKKPISHSESDIRCDLLRAHVVVPFSETLSSGPHLMEVSTPIGEFAKTALWHFQVSYKNPASLESVSRWHYALRHEAPVQINITEMLGDEATLYGRMLLDLAQRKVT